jgi:hypothetical protein
MKNVVSMLNDMTKSAGKLQFAIAFFWNIRYSSGRSFFVREYLNDFVKTKRASVFPAACIAAAGKRAAAQEPNGKER